MDVLFAKANEEKISPVKMAQIMPKLEGAELERELIKYFNDDVSSDGSLTDIEKSPSAKPALEESSLSTDNGRGSDSEKA